MTNRRLAWIAAAFAVLVQAGFVAGYARMTDGCFCAITQVPDPPPAPPHVHWFVHAAAHPLVLIGNVGGTRGSAYGAAVVNGIAWFAATWLLLKLLVLLTRVRVGSRVDGTGAGARRLFLVPAAGVRPGWVAAVVIIIAAGALTWGVLYRRWWLAESEAALRAAITAARAGTEPPAGIDLKINGGVIMEVPPSFAGPYQLEPEPESYGTHLLDAFVPPDGGHGWLRFAGRPGYEYYVFREAGGWRVSIFVQNH